MTLHRASNGYNGPATIEQGGSVASVRCDVRVLEAGRSTGGEEMLKPVAWHGGLTVVDQVELVPGPATLVLEGGQRGSIVIGEVTHFLDSELGFGFRALFQGVGGTPI